MLKGGPSKLDLLTSFSTAYAKTPNQPFVVTFTFAPDQELPDGSNINEHCTCDAVITGIRHEDGSGESFILTGRVRRPYNKHMLEYDFESYFDTKRRAGSMTITYDMADGKPWPKK